MWPLSRICKKLYDDGMVRYMGCRVRLLNWRGNWNGIGVQKEGRTRIYEAKYTEDDNDFGTDKDCDDIAWGALPGLGCTTLGT